MSRGGGWANLKTWKRKAEGGGRKTYRARKLLLQVHVRFWGIHSWQARSRVLSRKERGGIRGKLAACHGLMGNKEKHEEDGRSKWPKQVRQIKMASAGGRWPTPCHQVFLVGGGGGLHHWTLKNSAFDHHHTRYAHIRTYQNMHAPLPQQTTQHSCSWNEQGPTRFLCSRNDSHVNT